jgi:hypothetical protein
MKIRQISNTGHDSNKSKLHALINTDQIKFNDACHHSVQNLFDFAIYRYKN